MSVFIFIFANIHFFKFYCIFNRIIGLNALNELKGYLIGIVSTNFKNEIK
jgi:hypothetical protein